MAPSEFSMNIPPQCENCPMIAMYRDEYDMLSNGENAMFETFASDALADKVKNAIHRIDPTISDEAINEQLAVTIESMRQEALPIFDELSERREVIQEQVELDSEGCPGPSAMRAVDKLGRTVVMRFCTSPRKPLDAGPYPEPTSIERTTEQ
jgi:hypothetical protein